VPGLLLFTQYLALPPDTGGKSATTGSSAFTGDPARGNSDQLPASRPGRRTGQKNLLKL